MAATQVIPARCGSGKSVLPPIPPAQVNGGESSSKQSPRQRQRSISSTHAASSATTTTVDVHTSCQSVNALLGDAASACGDLMSQLLKRTEEVQKDIDVKLRDAIKRATASLQQDLKVARSAFDAEKAELQMHIQKLTTQCADAEAREKAQQDAIAEHKQREDALLAEQDKLAAAFASERKSVRDARDAVAALRLEHQLEIQALTEKYGGQLSEVDKSGEESKRKNQQLTNQIKQLREANGKLTSNLNEEEALRQKLEKQRRDEQSQHSSAQKKLSLELTNLKSQLSHCQQDLAKASKTAEQYEKQLTRQQAEHSELTKKAKSHHNLVAAGLNDKIQKLEQEIIDLRLHYQTEIERLRNEMAKKMHASLDTWLGQDDDALLKKLRKQNQEEQTKLDVERMAVKTAGHTKKKPQPRG